MIKIAAINDPSKDEDHPEDETITQVTKEAQVNKKIRENFLLLIKKMIKMFAVLQETIAVSEYMRALSLKQNGKPEFALSLFEDLLRTQVLSDVSWRSF